MIAAQEVAAPQGCLAKGWLLLHPPRTPAGLGAAQGSGSKPHACRAEWHFQSRMARTQTLLGFRPAAAGFKELQDLKVTLCSGPNVRSQSTTGFLLLACESTYVKNLRKF